MWLDVRCGLPFADHSVDSIYSTHMIEHLYPDELEKLLRACARVLKPGGGMRIIVPSLSNAILAFQQKRHDWFYDDFPRHFDSLEAASPISFSAMDNTALLSISVIWMSLTQGRISGSCGVRGRAKPVVWGKCSGVRTRRRCRGVTAFGLCGGI